MPVSKTEIVVAIGFLIVFLYIYPMYLFSSPLCFRNKKLCLPANIFSEEPVKLLVDTTSCKILDVDPFDKSIKRFIGSSRPIKCDSALVRVINESLVLDQHERTKKTLKESFCCYKAITRVNQDPKRYNQWADSTFRLSHDCVEIPAWSKGIKVDIPYAQIECQSESGTNLTMTDFHAIVLPPEKHSNKTKEKAKAWSNIKTEQKPPSVLIIGVDSTSRLHMIRSLPKTREFILKNDFIELKGYTKTGHNTFPNMMSSMAGLGLSEYPTCYPTQATKLDDCPFIWKNFSALNYMTAHLEDEPVISNFNHQKTGFVQQPSDYYLRTLMIAQQTFAGKQNGSYDNNCISGKSFTSYMLEYIKRFVKTVGSNYPYFLLSWFTSAGHSSFNGLKNYDEDFREFMNDVIENQDYDINNTIIFFISDHGYLFGGVRETFVGYYEGSLPFVFVRLPDSIKALRPRWYKNLQSNSDKLCSPLDLHETFHDILSLASSIILKSNNDSEIQKENDNSSDRPVNKRNVNNSSTSIELYSIFSSIPENRTCENSGIPPTFCMCNITPIEVQKKIPIEIFSTSLHNGHYVVQLINEILKVHINSNLCLRLKFSKLLYGREIKSVTVSDDARINGNYRDLVLAVEVEPGKGHFEANIRTFGNGTEVSLGPISRINSYQGQSECMSDYVLKNYCMCANVGKK